MAVYIATAANAFFWQKLAVSADSRDAACSAFQAYLDGPNQAQEAEEFNDRLAEEAPTDRAKYVYSVDYQGVEPDWDDEFSDRVSGSDVVMLDSGNHG